MSRSHTWPISLGNLPVEILCHILDNLEMHDLLMCSVVAKHLRKVVMQSSRLQYTIELEKYRMVSLLPESASLSFAMRLNLLRDRERAWKYMDWKKRHTLELPPTGSVYEFVGGLYGHGREDDTRMAAAISFVELPSSDAMFLGEPTEEVKIWTHGMGDIIIIDFTMDPSQDLLVLVALAPPESSHVYELHLRSIRTNQPHAKAPMPIIPCWQKTAADLHASDTAAAVRIQISGNLVALLIKEFMDSTSAHLEIWNWERNPQYSCAMTKPEIDDFTFLTQDTFLLVRPTGQFEVYTFLAPSKRSSRPRLRITYSLPPLSPGYNYWYISMSSNPAPGYVPRHSTDSSSQGTIPSSNRQVYYPRPEERIHACCLYLFDPNIEENPSVHSFVFFLNLQTLLNPPAEWISKAHTIGLTDATKRHIASGARSESYSHASTSTSSSMISSSELEASVPLSQGCRLTTSPPISSSNLTASSSSNPPLPPPSYASLYPPFPTFDSSNSQNEGSAAPLFNGRRPQVNRASLPRSISAHTVESGQRNRNRKTRSSIASIPPNTDIPWEVWGSQSTRWFEECFTTDWQHAIYGMRTVESVHPTSRWGKPILPTSIPKELPSSFITTINPASVSPETQSIAETSASGSPSQTQSAGVSSNSTLIQSQATSSDLTEAQAQGQMQAQASSSPNNGNGNGNQIQVQKRYLRLRDFNSYSFTNHAGAVVEDRSKSEQDQKSYWVEPRLITEASTTPVKGVFTQDIVSSLPYMEVISREPFEVTDVMMDDSRLLLLKRGPAGKLKHVDVLLL